MNRRFIAALVVGAGLVLGVASAQAGPCSNKIARFEKAVRQSAGNPGAGPMAPQSIGAQLDRQPTPTSVKRAEERAQASFNAAMARAKRLDAQGNRSGCTRALAAPKRMYNLPWPILRDNLGGSRGGRPCCTGCCCRDLLRSALRQRRCRARRLNASQRRWRTPSETPTPSAVVFAPITAGPGGGPA